MTINSKRTGYILNSVAMVMCKSAVLHLMWLGVYVCDTHSLQFFYTAVTPGINFTALGLVDGEQCVYYDSDIRKMISKTEWMRKISADDPDYWNRETERLQDHQDIMATVMKNLNQDEGNHTLQGMLGCGLDNGVTRGYSQYRYDGEDFISLDLNWNLGHGHESWTPANDKAQNFLMEWDPKGEKAKYWKDYLKNDCIDQLNKFVPYSKETLERKDLSVNPVSLASPEVVCHATGFFPEAVIISWWKDGEDVNEDVELRETPNQDGSFQKKSILSPS
ncbi:popy Class I histocompatibility antigen, A-1 alpha chain-like [Hemibagrus wyckioides]|uniref:popy Class I histocompatibility antigen, A-1 alpha chain-like n=1 Tax=Hemibagrus wyckioides TaxID=337641 RepID=UPI00266BA2DF|nr:popy Class I histocompatibility antigen, A-1 alpha chain-like [Hemibagrus wyckioides]